MQNNQSKNATPKKSTRARPVTPAFIATGALSESHAISRFHASVWFLGWRCLYAAVVNSRVDAKPLDLDAALRRVVSMQIGRLKAYGGKWRTWVNQGRHQRKPRAIPKKARKRKLLTQTKEGEYEIHPALLDVAAELGLTQR